MTCNHPGLCLLVDRLSEEEPVAVETFGGRVHVEWDSQAQVTMLGQLPFFVEYLQVSGLFDPFVADCPLVYRRPNAPDKRDIPGTLLLSILAGHRRYAHIGSLRSDGINPDFLGMGRVMSEASFGGRFRRWMKKPQSSFSCLSQLSDRRASPGP